MTIEKRIQLMEYFTETYKMTGHMPKSQREITCMATQFPEVFVEPFEKDLFAGRFIMLPVGHGLEWAHLGGGDVSKDRKSQITHNGSSIPEMNSAGSSYYGLVEQLEAMLTKTDDVSFQKRISDLIVYWKENDTHAQMIRTFSKSHHPSLYDADITNFLPPFLAMTRLSGIEMDYEPLLNKGIPAFKNELEKRNHALNSEFLTAGVGALSLLEGSIHHYIQMLTNSRTDSNADRFDRIIDSMKDLLSGKPSSFHSAIQLMFLYSQLAGVVNYGRMDDYLGGFLVEDLEEGRLTEEDAIDYLVSLWYLIDESCNRGNGRVIIGGQGRNNSNTANKFAELAIKATMVTMTAKPQLTLRLDESTPESLYDLGLDAIGKGCTFPMLYNDKLNVPSVEKAMNVSPEDAKHYVPYGCGEYVINGRGTGSPNACVNFTKVLQLSLTEGYDPYDGIYRGGDFDFKTLDQLTTYEKFQSYYFDYLDYVLETTIHFQHESYQYMAERSSFVFASLLMHDCIGRDKPMLDGGIRYYSGVNEFYGFSNAIDSITAIKDLVYDRERFTLTELVDAIKADFSEAYTPVKEAIDQVPKFGNDIDYVDSIGVRLHEHACGYIRDHASEVGLHSFLAVNINNNANTRWGMKTGASPDGRLKGDHLSPGNNPHSGRDTNGITAMLNSISKLRPDIHAGYVQNLKCSPKLFNDERTKTKMILKTYWNKPGGTQIMINVVDQATLLDAQKRPEKHQNLIVRCGGFSARFIELDRNTQKEIIERTCNV